MSIQATGIYERGTLHLLTPIDLPERARVHIQILEDATGADQLRRAEGLRTDNPNRHP